MSVVAIIAALLLEQWRPLVDRAGFHALLSRWAGWLSNTFNAGESHHGRIAWLVAIAPAVLGSLALYYLLYWLHPLFALALNIAALYVTLGFRQFSHYFTAIQLELKSGNLDRARELIGIWRGESSQHRTKEEIVRLAIEEALAASHQHVFAVLFWFMVLPGPSGAILYRLAGFLARRWRDEGVFGQFARRVNYAMEWPAVRLTAIGFAIVGDFEDAIYCWRSQAANWVDANLGIVLSAGAGALGVRLGMPLTEADGTVLPRADLGVGEAADVPFLDSTVGLLWRSLVVWVFLLALLTIVRIFG
jgi:adenosylcobinamide-phosphate synthase